MRRLAEEMPERRVPVEETTDGGAEDIDSEVGMLPGGLERNNCKKE